METRLLYNYKKGDNDLSARIDALRAKLNFGTDETLQSRIDDAVTTAVEAEQALREAADTALGNRLDAMQLEIDGAISTFFMEGEPSENVPPAADWEDEATRNQHLGDLYYDTETGYCYRWMRNDDEFEWQLVKDTDVTAALANAQAAQETADQKAQTYMGAAEPTMQSSPASTWSEEDYEKHDGDLFFDSATGYLYRFENGDTPDWVRVKDSDITTAQTAADNAQTTADSKIQTHAGTGAPTLENSPAVGWTEEDYPKHTGDLYFDTATGYTYRFDLDDDTGEYAWTRIKDSDITAAENASVPLDQGVENAYHHLVVGADGLVTSSVPSQLLMTNAAGTKTFVVTIGDDGELIVSEVVGTTGG